MMRTYRPICSVLFIVASIATLLGFPFAHAQVQGTTIKPIFIEERIDAGGTITQVLTIQNTSEESQILYPTVRDVQTMEEDGTPIFVPEGIEKSGAEISSWTYYSVNAVALEPKEEAQVTVTFSVPADAPHGGYFGMVAFLNEAPELADNETGVLGVDYIVGALVSLRVGEDATDEAFIREFKSSKKFIGSADGSFETRIENTGNALIRPIGVIGINDMFGRTVASTSFNADGGAILPGVARQYLTDWKADGLHIGRFEAFLAVNYGDTEKKTLTATTSFWILPGKLSLIVGGALLAFFLIVYGWSRMYIRRRLRAAGVSDSGSHSAASSGPMFMAVLIAVIVTAFVLLGFAFFFLV